MSTLHARASSARVDVHNNHFARRIQEFRDSLVRPSDVHDRLDVTSFHVVQMPAANDGLVVAKLDHEPRSVADAESQTEDHPTDAHASKKAELELEQAGCA